MNRRTLIATCVATSVTTGCYYPQYFDVAWDEEVQLHDGSVIVVNFKFTHERLDRFSRYGSAGLRDTTMSFDAGPPHGRVTQTFKRMQPVLLNRYDGVWYAVIVPRGAGDSPTITGQDWGPMQNGEGQWPLKLSAQGVFQPMRLEDFPDAIVAQHAMHGVRSLFCSPHLPS